MAHARLGHRYMSFAVPAGSDNTPTEAGVNKLFSAAFPVCLFLCLVASFMVARSYGSPLVSHMSGQKNVWPDELSRDKLDRLKSKPLASPKV